MRRIPGLLVLTLAAACNGEPPPPPARPAVDYAQLAQELEAWTPERGVERLAEAEALLDEIPEDAAARADYVRCLQGYAHWIIELQSGDPYAQLARAREVLADPGLSGALCEERERLADDFFAIGNYHAAVEMASSGDCPAPDAEFLAWLRGPLEVLAASRPAIFADEPADPLIARLVDLFAMPALNSWYDLSGLSLSEDWTPPETHEVLEAGAFLKRVLDDGPPPEDYTTDSYRDSIVDLSGVALDAATRAEIARASAAVREGASPDDLPALTELFELMLEGASPLEHRSLDGGLVLTLSGDEMFGVMLIVERGEETPVYWREEWEPSAIRLIDLNADGKDEVVLSSRAGSGGFLDVECLEVDPLRAVFAEEAVHKGGLVMVQLDPDPPLEMLLTWGTDQQTVECNQCPRKFASAAFDYDPELRVYHPVAFRVGSAERLIRAYGFTGMGPHMFLELLHDEHDTKSLFRELEEAEELSEERVLEVLRIVFEFGGHYRSLSAHDEAIAMLRDFCAAIGRPDAPGDVPQMRAAAQIFAAQLAYEGLEIQAGIDLMDEPWFVERAAADDSVRRDRLIVRANLCQLVGRLDEEFEHYSEVLEMEPEPQRDVLGNLASYYNLVGEYDQARVVAERALDQAVAAGDTRFVMLDMLHLASSAFHQEDHLASLEWIERALPLARALPTGGYDIALLGIAADIALVNERSDIALELLDESLMVVDEAMWASGGGAVLLLAGTALERMGDPAKALRAYETASRLGAPVDSQVHATAAHRASVLLHAVLEDEEAALRHAEEAFAAAVTGRERIGVEGHQFSFLSDKEHIVEWLVQRLWEDEAQRGQIAEVIGAWKLQVFRDTYRKQDTGSGAMAGGVPEPPAGTALLDYFLGEECAFVVARLAGQPPEVISLPCTGPEVQTLVEEVYRAFDLRDADSLRAIRANEVSAELARNLRRVHELLLDPVGLSDEVTRIVLAPDDEMFGVPWAAVSDGSGRRLVDGPRVSLVPSLRLMTSGGPGEAVGGRACVVGAFGELRNGELPPWARSTELSEGTVVLPRLRYGLDECEAISEALLSASFEVGTMLDPEREAFSGTTFLGRPTAAALLESLPGQRLVHVTAHGLFHERSPMDSCVFLADRQVLRARDLAALDLTEVELISLAACQSGMNEARVGAEPMGFLRSLLGAGARRVLVAEWEVDDRRTKELMSGMYRRAASLPLSEALQAAQREIRGDFEHPYYWAGLTMYETTLE